MVNMTILQSVNNSTAAPGLQKNAPILVESIGHSFLFLVLIIIFYVFLYCTSGIIVNCILNSAGIDETDEQKDTGTAIGKVENVLVLTLILLEAYTALGVIFAAKSIVRSDDIGTGDTSYYLTGTLSNFTYSVVVGVVLHLVIRCVITFW